MRPIFLILLFSSIGICTFAQANQFKTPPPKAITAPDKKTPSQKEWNAWYDAAEYGLWIDGKRTQNENLSKIGRTSIVYFNKSKLYKNAVNYGKHTYQLDLYTEPYFDKVWASIEAKKKAKIIERRKS